MALAEEKQMSPQEILELYQRKYKQDPIDTEKRVILAALQNSKLVHQDKVQAIIWSLQTTKNSNSVTLATMRKMISQVYPQLGKEIDDLMAKIAIDLKS